MTKPFKQNISQN